MHILEVGRYAWCTCGKSSTMPFCDHPAPDPDGSDAAPAEVREGCAPHWFSVTRQQLYAVCNCRITNHPPYCDFRHRLIQAAKRKRGEQGR